MGKLKLEQDDITRLCATFTDNVSIDENAVKIKLGESELVLDDLKSTGHFEQNGVRFKIDASYDENGLQVDFE